jgi:hypothetical protein
MAAQMLKTLKGKVLDDLSAAHKEALKQAPKPTSQAAAGADGAPVDKEGNRFANRLAQDRMEGGFGFVMTANSVGDNHFAREQTAALKRADEQKREMEAAALSDFEASKARAASEALEKDRETEAKAAKSFVWGAASLKVKRAPGPVHIEPAEAPDPKAKRQKAAPQASNSDGEDGAEARGDGEPAATDNATSGTLAGLGDYSSSSSDSDD